VTIMRISQIVISSGDLKFSKSVRAFTEQFRVVFEVLNELMAAPEPKRRPIGFSVKERRARYSAREC